MNINRSKLGEIATVEISGVDKKIKDGERPVKPYRVLVVS
jgi:hypothetical protein